MATQRCPKCKSDRVRLGYRPTSIFLKIIFRYNLLCDQCNWEFTGFAIPGTVPKKSKKKRQNDNSTINERSFQEKKDVEEIDPVPVQPTSNGAINTSEQTENKSTLIKTKVKKKVRTKLF